MELLQMSLRDYGEKPVFIDGPFHTNFLYIHRIKASTTLTPEQMAMPFWGPCKFEYMGAAEFEHGLVPSSFKRFRSVREKITVTKLAIKAEIGDGLLVSSLDMPIWVITPRLFPLEYQFVLQQLYGYNELGGRGFLMVNVRCKEDPHLMENLLSKNPRANIWWDYLNDVIFTSSEALADAIPKLLQNTYGLLDAGGKK